MFLLDVSGDHDAYLSVQSHAFLTPKWARALGGRGGGVLRILSGGMIEGFFGFEIFDSTIFIWEGKFGKYFFGDLI